MTHHLKRLTALVFVLVAGVGLSTGTGCATMSGGEDADVRASSQTLAPFFADIPAETSFVFAGLEPAPGEWGSSGDDGMKRYIRVAGWMESAGLLPPILQELHMALQQGASLETLGLAARPRFAMYGLGPVPVYKLELGSPSAFQKTLDRLESQGDLGDIDKGTRQGTHYRIYRQDDALTVLALRDGALFVSVAPPAARRPVLAHLVGTSSPDSSLAETTRLAEIRSSHDVTRQGVGYVDIAGLVRNASGVESPSEPGGAVWEALELGPDSNGDISQACRNEAESIARAVPRAVMGVEAWSETNFAIKAGLEVDHERMTRIADVSGDIPGMGSKAFEASTLALGAGMQMREVSKLVGDWADDVFSSPYRCGTFQPLNRWTRRLETGASSIPGWGRILRGVGLVVQEMQFGGSIRRPESLRALLVARAEDAPTMIQQLNLFIPGLDQLNPESPGPPMRLRALDKRLSFIRAPHVAVQDDVIGLSAGAGMREELSVLLEGNVGEHPDTILALSIDPTALNEQLPSGWTRQVPLETPTDVWMTSRHRLQLDVDSDGVFVRYASSQP